MRNMQYGQAERLHSLSHALQTYLRAPSSPGSHRMAASEDGAILRSRTVLILSQLALTKTVVSLRY